MSSMYINSKILKVLVIVVIFSCHNKYPSIKYDVYNRNINTDNAIVISCNRCSCITQFFASNSDSFFLQKKNIQLLADSNCMEDASISFKHLEQKVLDSIYEDNYNAVLFKGKKVKILKTEDADKFQKILTEFFD